MAGKRPRIGLSRLGPDRKISFTKFVVNFLILLCSHDISEKAVAALVNPGDPVLVESPVYACVSLAKCLG